MNDLPPDIEQSSGTVQYEETGEFPVERGYIWTTCSSVENGNPLFWDDAVAADITNGPIAPPTMLSVWFRPHHWAPGRTQQALPLQHLGHGRSQASQPVFKEVVRCAFSHALHRHILTNVARDNDERNFEASLFEQLERTPSVKLGHGKIREHEIQAWIQLCEIGGLRVDDPRLRVKSCVAKVL